MQARPGGPWLQTSLEAKCNRNRPFSSLVPAVIWVVPAQPLGLLQVAQAEEEKANQERCFARTRMLCAHLYLKSVLQYSIHGNLHICAHHPKVRCIWIQV